MKSILKRKFTFGRATPEIAIFEMPATDSSEGEEDEEDHELAAAEEKYRRRRAMIRTLQRASVDSSEDLVRALKVGVTMFDRAQLV